MQTWEWVVTAAVILVPLAVAVVVTLWSLEQVRYRRKTWRPPESQRETGSPARAAGSEGERS